ncbi:MAG: hypothetical protein A2277_00430 [Desulfobacterales bacterium RIFOXYA12_FULL_46_15]|nr:MAG: hypothetical protein A2277_00430 [Desulfobacterales bacterium RIFOXYA12_FULL_46_15]
MKRDAQMIVGLALTDINFRQQLKTDFAAATKDYRLSDDEVTGIQTILNDGDIDKIAADLEASLKKERINAKNDDGLLW